MRRNSIRIIIIAGIISITGIISAQLYFIHESLNIKEKQLNQSINIALRNVAEHVYKYNNNTIPYENPVYQYSNDYFIVNLNDFIDAEILEHYLVNEFKHRNILLDFEYAIFDCQNNEMIYGDYIQLSKENVFLRKKTQLPICDKYLYYFGIRFPERQNYILSSMKVLYFFSSILTLVIIFLGYSLFIILKQKKLSEIQKDFVNNMTHEFKTPLASISMSADVISSPEIINEPSRLSNYSAIIKNQTNLLLSHIENILQVADSNLDRLKLNKNKLDIHKIINHVVENFSGRIEKNDGKITLGLKAKEFIAYADEYHISNVFYNLLDNAIKYSNKTLACEISTVNKKNKVYIYISDNGPGIPKKFHSKIFLKFFRVPAGNIHNTKGFGLGLNYVNKIIKMHKWKIKVTSSEGNGTTFLIIANL